MTVAGQPGYVGPDRRKPISVGGAAFLWRMVGAGAAIMLIWFVFAVVVEGERDLAESALISLTHAIAGALMLTAGTLRFTEWRITGTARSAWGVIALLIAGFSIPALGIMNRMALADANQFAPASLTRGYVEITLIGIGVAALMSPPVIAKLKPLRTALPFIAGALGMAGVVVVAGPSAGPSGAWATAGTLVTALIPALWFALALAFMVTGGRRGARSDVLIGIVLLVPAADALARTMVGPVQYPQMLISVCVELFLACVVAGSSGLSLWSLETGRGSQLLAVTGALHGVQSSLEEHERDEARRLHDARNAMLAVSGAVHLLANQKLPTNGRATIDSAHLERLVTVELERLGGLLDPGFRRRTRTFFLAGIIEPLILAHQVAGGTITADVVDCEVIGRPDTAATAIANILSNARAHAPGAHVWITVETVGDDAHISIADNGPGIPAGQRAMALMPGVRGAGATAPGSGIGLASAAQAMSEQGGTLRIDERPGGGTMITLTLPRPVPPCPETPSTVLEHALESQAAGGHP